MMVIVDKAVGLTSQEVQQLKRQFGPNIIRRAEAFPWLRLFLGQFSSPLIWILLIAVSITGFLLKKWVDAGVIAAAVCLNTLLGFIQEYRAQRALRALRHFLAPTARVIRGGKRQDVPAEELVPNDVVILEIGRLIPADGVLVEADSLSVEEAILTGESMPVDKHPINASWLHGFMANNETMKQFSYGNKDGKEIHTAGEETSRVFMGTTVVTGIGKMIVTAIGQQTKMGQIASSLRVTNEPPTPLQQQLIHLARNIGIGVGLVAVAVFLMGLLTHREPTEMFELSVAMAVAAIPEGLAISLTVILTVGMRRLLKRRALVRQLVAAETLGRITTICVDKTGTLTEGKMRVVASEFTDDYLGKVAVAACNDLRDPLETAMHAWVPDADQIVRDFPRTDEIPFSPNHKYIATLHPSKELLLVSGAPEVLLAKTTLSKEEKDRWSKQFNHYGSKGLRLVSVAYKKVNNSKEKLTEPDVAALTWLGIIIFEDPVRAGVSEALKQAQQLGLSIHVITGDFRPTSEAVINKLGVAAVTLHARVKPEEKLAIVNELQARGEIVAMTGDGVNDAPALKAANIGIVVASASDVSKEIADMVLLDNNFSTITAAIIQGRGMLANLKKVITYLLSDAFAGVTAVAVSLFLPVPTPLLATQILWINLISDGLPSLALTVEPHDEINGVKRSKQAASGSLLDRQMKTIITVTSFLIGLTTLLGFILTLRVTGDVTRARSVAFALLGTSSLFYVFSVRSLTQPIWRIPHLLNPFLLLAVVAGFLLQLAPLYLRPLQSVFHTTALLPIEWTVIFLAGVALIAVIELLKWRTNSPAA